MKAPPLRGTGLPELPTDVLLRIVDLSGDGLIEQQIKARLCLESCCKALRLGLRHQVWPAVNLLNLKAVRWALERKPVTHCLTVYRFRGGDTAVGEVLKAVVSVSREVLTEVSTDYSNGISLERPLSALRTLSCQCDFTTSQLSATFPALRNLRCKVLRCEVLNLSRFSGSLPALVKLECPDLYGIEQLIVSFPALQELDCEGLDLSRLNGSLPALVNLSCTDLSGVEQLSRTFPALTALYSSGEHLDFSQLRGSVAALVSLECFSLSLGGCSASFPALRELQCDWMLHLEECSASFPVLTELSCGCGDDTYGQVFLGQSRASFPALTRISCNMLYFEQCQGSFPALGELVCGQDDWRDDGDYGVVQLGQYRGSFPALATVDCSHLDLGHFSGSFPALTALTAVSGVEGLGLDVMCPALRSLWLITGSKAAQMVQPPRLPPGITKLRCHGLEAAAHLETLQLMLNPEQGKEEVELSQQALSTLALLKLHRSLKKSYLAMAAPPALGPCRLPADVLLRILDLTWDTILQQNKARLRLESCCKELHRGLRLQVWPAVYLGSAKAVRWALERKPVTRDLRVNWAHDKTAVQGVLDAVTFVSREVLINVWADHGIGISLERSLPALRKLSCVWDFTASQLSATFPALGDLSCRDFDLSQFSGSLPALVKLYCFRLSGIEQLGATLPALAELCCWDLDVSHLSKSLPALVKLECGRLHLGRCSASFLALRELECEWDLYLEESSASFPVLTELSCGCGEDPSGQVFLGQSRASFPALTRISCNRLHFEQCRGSFPALIKVECGRDEWGNTAAIDYGDVRLGQCSGCFPALVETNCCYLDPGQYSGSFPALTALTAVRGVGACELDVMFPALRRLWLTSWIEAAQRLPSSQLPPKITELACHVSIFPGLVNPRMRQLETLALWCDKRELPEGLEAAARLQTLELVLNPEPDRKEGELSQEALSTLALLKLQHSLKKVAVSTGCKRFFRGQYLILAAMGLCPPPHPRRARHPC
ncbi:hypothetical protein N2152v2_002534 [Parachlorella kessleri]